MVDIVVEYHQYVPGSLDSDPISCILYGDALSCERANDAQNARINGESKWDRLQGLVPAIQEWHKHGILLEAHTSLYIYVRNRCRHHNVNSKTSSCFNYATDLLCFATKAYVIASSRSMIDKDNIPKDIEKLWCYFQFIAKKLQDCNADSSNCGLCQLESDNEEWFHLTCLGLSDNDVPVGEWFCSGQYYKSNQDHIFEYSKALLWRGLGEMARHDAIREGDGDRIISNWRHDMIVFDHALNGGMSSHLAHQLRWNITVGKVGHNLEMESLRKGFRGI
ncbi:hypothetical protein ACJMK2_030872 [Sinanodonta woodiana]|uniref:DUF6589 domain-containing protein n=1 Tax=Sinanodonta woodiana TaxID=1069815 RepID=A0ABD3WXM5_SINWO